MDEPDEGERVSSVSAAPPASYTVIITELTEAGPGRYSLLETIFAALFSCYHCKAALKQSVCKKRYANKGDDLKVT